MARSSAAVAGRLAATAFSDLVAEDAEGGDSAAFGLGEAPQAQRLFEARIGRKFGPVRRARRRGRGDGDRFARPLCAVDGAAAFFFLPLRALVAACAASFISRSPGTISSSASPSGVRLALR